MQRLTVITAMMVALVFATFLVILHQTFKMENYW
uniref:Uncharacterized protein n=1 Tax=Brassica oleracea TaxID=3712 RepID=A0A3P6B5U5_BRAOL|nr:unnamed protein product [Brassica oleracea]